MIREQEENEVFTKADNFECSIAEPWTARPLHSSIIGGRNYTIEVSHPHKVGFELSDVPFYSYISIYISYIFLYITNLQGNSQAAMRVTGSCRALAGRFSQQQITRPE